MLNAENNLTVEMVVKDVVIENGWLKLLLKEEGNMLSNTLSFVSKQLDHKISQKQVYYIDLAKAVPQMDERIRQTMLNKHIFISHPKVSLEGFLPDSMWNHKDFRVNYVSIIPFACVGKETYFLIGLRNKGVNGKVYWDAFGGPRKSNEDCEWAAARKLCEGTNGLIGGSLKGGGCKALYQEILKSPDPVLYGPPPAFACTYFLRVLYNDCIPSIYGEGKTGNEMRQLKWVKRSVMEAATRKIDFKFENSLLNVGDEYLLCLNQSMAKLQNLDLK